MRVILLHQWRFSVGSIFFLFLSFRSTTRRTAATGVHTSMARFFGFFALVHRIGIQFVLLGRPFRSEGRFRPLRLLVVERDVETFLIHIVLLGVLGVCVCSMEGEKSGKTCKLELLSIWLCGFWVKCTLQQQHHQLVYQDRITTGFTQLSPSTPRLIWNWRLFSTFYFAFFMNLSSHSL